MPLQYMIRVRAYCTSLEIDWTLALCFRKTNRLGVTFAEANHTSGYESSFRTTHLKRGLQAHQRNVENSKMAEGAAFTRIATSNRRPIGLTASHRLEQPARHAPPPSYRHCATGIDPQTRNKHSGRNTTSATIAHTPHPRTHPLVHRVPRPSARRLPHAMLPLSSYSYLDSSLYD